jgi:uncharacterized protein (DUF2384 family)
MSAWTRRRPLSIEELAELQAVKPMENIADWAADIFESDEEFEGFLRDMRAHRNLSFG